MSFSQYAAIGMAAVLFIFAAIYILQTIYAVFHPRWTIGTGWFFLRIVIGVVCMLTGFWMLDHYGII